MGCLKKGEGITKMLNEGYQIKLIWRLFGSHQVDCETMNPFWTRTGEFLPVLYRTRSYLKLYMHDTSITYMYVNTSRRCMGR